MTRTKEQQELIAAIKRDDGKRPACAILVEFDGNDLLVCWHGDHAENDPYDLYVFQEVFRYDTLVKWQTEMFETAKQIAPLGNRRRSSLVQTHVATYDMPLTPELMAVLRKTFGMVEPF